MRTHAFLLSFGLLLSCSEERNVLPYENGTLLWVNSTHSDLAIKKAFKEALEHSSIITAQITWSPTDADFFQNAAWYFNLAKDHGKGFMLNIDWQSSDRLSTNGDWSFEDSRTAELFKRDVVRLVRTYNPDYLNMGVEANYYALTEPEGFRAYAIMFRELKIDLLKLKPQLKVGLSYQLELLYGHHDEWSRSQSHRTLDVLLGDIDFLGISTYPNIAKLEHHTVVSSLEYIDSLTQKYAVPIGISETGVDRNIYTIDQRCLYVKTVFEKAKNLHLEFVVWGSIMDAQQNRDWSNRIGLLDLNGNPKDELTVWKIANSAY